MDKPRTKHFRLSEFEGHGPCPKRYWPNIQKTMDALEVIREALGGHPISVTKGGGYRSPDVNRKNKGRATKSQHLYGRAADIRVKGGIRRAFYIIAQLQADGLIPKGGLAAYPSFVHVDIRGRRARWRKNP